MGTFLVSVRKIYMSPHTDTIWDITASPGAYSTDVTLAHTFRPRTQATPVLSNSITTVAKAAAPATEASSTEGSSKAHYAAAFGGIAAGIFGAYTVASASEQGDGMHSPHYPWSHDGPLDSYDHGSMRRGHKVTGCFIRKIWAEILV